MFYVPCCFTCNRVISPTMFYVLCCFTCNWVISATFTTLLTDGYSYKHNILFLITYLIEHIHLYNTQSVHMLSWSGQLFHVQNRIMKSLFNKGIIIQKDIEEVLYMYRINL